MQVLDLLVRLPLAEARVEVDGHQSGHGQSEPPPELAADDLGDQRLRPLARAAELDDVQAVVVGLDDRRQQPPSRSGVT